MSKQSFIRFCSLSIVFAIGNCCCYVGAQSSFDDFKRKMDEKFNKFKETNDKEFEDFRDRVNQEFAEFMRHAWDRHESEPPMSVPPMPEPPEPEVADPATLPSEETLPFADIILLPVAPDPLMPLIPMPEDKKPKIDINPKLPTDPAIIQPTTSKKNGIPFIYYGSTYFIPIEKSLRFSLLNVDENSVANAWNELSNQITVNVVKRCVDLHDDLRLSDWGYFRLIENISNTLFPNDLNKATLLQMFLLTQSGYKVRIARQGNDLVLLMPCKESIYNFSYIPKNGINYYMINRKVNNGSIYVFDHEFPREKLFSLAIQDQPILAVSYNQESRFEIHNPLDIVIDVAVNKNLIDFYNDYPKSGHWNIYANSSLSEEVKNQLYPKFKDCIEGKSKKEAANILLHFVQKAFKYQTDQEQFGIERSLFPDETFYYPYSDCEDRAILYSVLVRELLGLDVVLVHYPEHIATAVAFDEPVTGDYFEIDGRKFTVCDPIYINADIGMAMKQFKSTPAEIIKL